MRCPYCKEKIKMSVLKCPKCHTWLEDDPQWQKEIRNELLTWGIAFAFCILVWVVY